MHFIVKSCFPLDRSINPRHYVKSYSQKRVNAKMKDVNDTEEGCQYADSSSEEVRKSDADQ